MDLLTKEQAAVVERIREIQEQRNLWHHEKILPVRQVGELLSILDEAVKTFNAYSLLSEAVRSMQRQYTEAELRATFEKEFTLFNLARWTDSGIYISSETRYSWVSFCLCARFLGALKE